MYIFHTASLPSLNSESLWPDHFSMEAELESSHQSAHMLNNTQRKKLTKNTKNTITFVKPKPNRKLFFAKLNGKRNRAIFAKCTHLIQTQNREDERRIGHLSQ